MKEQLILVINCGSSSLKFSLICLSNQQTLLSGLAENLNTSDAQLILSHNGKKTKSPISADYDHSAAIQAILSHLKQMQYDSQVIAIGHRIVHGGEIYSAPTLITDKVIESITALSSLAPLHNPANIIGVQATKAAFPDLPQVAVFDTAFHQSMPDYAYLYALPYELYKEHGIRRYGFHGTSHYFVAKQVAVLLGRETKDTCIITAHLGNGCSITAIKNGKSVDTSMGLTPLEGVAMGTRSGDIDPGLLLHLESTLGYSIDKVNKLLNKESGLKGLSGLTNDCRTLEDAAINDDNEQAKLALEVFCYRIAKTICSYTAALSRLDAIVFTGGIGENSSYVRENIIKRLGLLNCVIDNDKNLNCRFGKSGCITQEDARPCYVIPTNEEWVIAEQTQQVLLED